MAELHDVLDHLTEEGHLDELRKKVLEELKHNKDLQEYIMGMLDNSKILQDPHKIDSWPKKKILDELRKERDLESKVAEKAYQVATSIMCDETGEVLASIQTRVHEALCAVYEARMSQLQAGVAHSAGAGGQADHSHHHSHGSHAGHHSHKSG